MSAGKGRFLRTLLIAAVLLIVTAYPVQAAYKKRTSKCSWVFVGDSYITHRKSGGVVDFLVKKMGLSPENYRNISYSGYGYVGKKVDGTKSIMPAFAGIRQDIHIRKVLIMLGPWNDCTVPKSQLKAAMNRFFDRLEDIYPNANFYYAIPHWHANWVLSDPASESEAVAYQDIVMKRIPWYKSVCKAHGIKFLTDVTNVLRRPNNEKYFSDDGHHPSYAGRKRIAKRLAKALKAAGAY